MRILTPHSLDFHTILEQICSVISSTEKENKLISIFYYLNDNSCLYGVVLQPQNRTTLFNFNFDRTHTTHSTLLVVSVVWCVVQGGIDPSLCSCKR